MDALKLLQSAASLYEAHGQMPNSLELAFLGDAVYTMYVRFRLAPAGGRVRDAHRAASGVVCAHAQAEALTRIEGLLTGEELDVARRARNCAQTPSKNADAAEYHRATALEALIGYLCIKGKTERADELIRAALGI
ncbi:MAG: Mini-ribonuclease 3 [Christensenellales bacterium]|jgi:ribonuclease-3 family protein